MTFRTAPLLLACLAFAFANDLAADDVLAFGAAGDGETDDTAAIQRAIDESADGVVRLPRGDYRLTETLEVDLAAIGRFSMDGSGGTARLLMTGPGPALRIVGTHEGTAGPTSFKPEVWERERMPQVTGLEIVGDHPEADGIELIGTMQPTLQRLLLRKLRHGIVVTERNRNVLVDACHVYENSEIGIFFKEVNLHQCIIQGSHISYNKRGGIVVLGGEIRNFHVTGCDIEYNFDTESEGSADILFDMREGSLAEGSIVSNTIQARPSPGGANIRFIGPERPVERTLSGLWAITGNLIGNQETNIHLVRSRGIAISGNHIYTGVKRTLNFEECHHIVVGDNSLDQSHNFRGGFTNGVTVKDCDGVILKGLLLDRAGDEKQGGSIEILNSRETTVSGCQIFEPNHRGLYVSESRNTRVSDNVIVHRGEEPKMVAAIEVVGDSPGTLISGNLVGKGSEGDILTPSETSYLGENHPAAPTPHPAGTE
ncbi:MAG: right-handed parallel beta-helix repeat-containing protein [Verrucomicrobiales bacterium]